MIYDYYNADSWKRMKRKIGIIAAVVAIVIMLVIAVGIYMEIIQLQEIGNLQSIYIKNLTFNLIFFFAVFALIFIIILLTNRFTISNIRNYLKENSLPSKRLPNITIAIAAGLLGGLVSSRAFSQNVLTYLNWVPFGQNDPIFGQDLGYYIFQRPFLMAIYQFVSVLWLAVIVYTAAYYMLAFASIFSTGFTMSDLKIKSVIRHNLINIAIFFLIKAVSYKFQMEGLLYSDFFNVNGAGYVDINIWMNYFRLAPFLLLVIAVAALILMWKGRLRKAAYTIAIFPVIWGIVSIAAVVTQSFIVKPNEFDYEKQYLINNMKMTRSAYGIDNVQNYDFSDVKPLTSEIVARNSDIVDNIRVVDYKATLDSDKQLQSNTNFYTFFDGDIINYNINGKQIPIFITAREMNKDELPEKSYTNIMFRYTHGYGAVINPINRTNPQGQSDFILSGIELNSKAENIKVTEPRIYYGELTKDYVVVNPETAGKLKEIDADGRIETSYTGKGGIKLNFFKRLLFAVRYGDINMLISGNISSESKLLLNREIVSRAQRAVPFLEVDTDPYIILTDDGRLKWVLDAYTVSQNYPYAQKNLDYGSLNYIRNSVKIVIDAYDGDIQYYIIDKNDPIIQTYNKIYPGFFLEDALPADIAAHTRYPELLFKIQSDMLKRYHLDPDTGDTAADMRNVSSFYGKQDLWNTAAMPASGTGEKVDIEPFYNMITLPDETEKTNELILMLPFTPSGERHNLVSWLAVKNNYDEYGKMILFNFPKNRNIFGPYQVEVKINQIDSVSKDMSLWNQSGSEVFKGNLLVIPIENSLLYVEPIYIKSSPQSIPEVREIIVGYQDGNEFKHGIGTNLDSALRDLLKEAPAATEPGTQQPPNETGGTGVTPGIPPAPADQELINGIIDKYDEMVKQLDELGKLIEQLKKE